MNVTIIDAIRNRTILEFFYKNHRRQVQPHKYGVCTSGDEKMECWQVAGGSDSGKPPGWRLITVSECRGIVDTGITFEGPHHDYNPQDNRFTRIYARL
jgi:hypothetical protein